MVTWPMLAFKSRCSDRSGTNTMLQNLASYLLGGTTTNPGQAGGALNSDSDNRVALRTTDYDDGWTMVDRDSEGNSDDSSHDSASEDDSDSGMDVVRLGRASSVDSLVHVHAMEESWFVTPPPCFSSQTGTKNRLIMFVRNKHYNRKRGKALKGLAQIFLHLGLFEENLHPYLLSSPALRTSPLENLLIEHPSMSVYQRTGSRHPHLHSPARSNASEGAIVVEEEVMEDSTVAEGSMVVYCRPHSPARRARPTVLVSGIHEVQLLKHRQAQKIQTKKVAKQLTRGYLKRANKAREVNGHNYNPRRKERSQGSNRSHASNNRKC
ncbi:hypothetical protein D910_12441 [Dendroctonus ponderosae]|uniref:Uncharacterized protein n=1 Tax=Dendroctonus ponderosae TaxID=77166 RepID=U4UPZ2_DENPD|nr:hypothetical protein D910_12441 [Dendroctonus ponderosae]